MGSYPGGKSGAGIYQRLINLIPPHRVLIVPFAGHCGVVRNIKPAEHTIVIDANPTVCDWWEAWGRSKAGRALEIHNCDGIEWLRYTLGTTKYSDAQSRGTRETLRNASEAFIFGDPPYVISERATGRIYDCELDDSDHQRFLGTVTQIDASKYSMMICGYACDLYSPLDRWFSIDHRVPTRGGLQDERIWMNYKKPIELHDYQYIGDGRRERERIRRRQINWREQLLQMSKQERLAMLEVLNATGD
jgi:site-specific DNA-adenine methylase